MEYGVKFPKGIQHLRKQVPAALEDAENELTMVACTCLRQLLDQLISLDKVIKAATATLVDLAKQIHACSRLEKIPGVGWLVASMLYARLGDGSAFWRGRDSSASLGLVPAHAGSGGKNRLGKITKRECSEFCVISLNYQKKEMVHERKNQLRYGKRYSGLT